MERKKLERDVGIISVGRRIRGRLLKGLIEKNQKV